MRKRKELASEEKVSLVEEYLAGRLRMREAAREARLGHSTMENWISRYRSEGASGLRENGNQAKCQYSWGGGGISVGPGQFYVHCGKVSTVLGKSGIGLGEGVS